jgi:PKD repeat protein
VYTFQGTAGERIFLDIQAVDGGCGAGPGPLGWRLIPPGGENFHSGAIANCSYQDEGPMVLSATGTYTVTVEAQSGGPETGTYAFELLSVPAPEAYPMDLGSPVGPDSPGAGAGRIESPGAEDVYTFSAVAGERIFLDVLEVDGGCDGPGPLEWEMSGPTFFWATAHMTSCASDYGPVLLPADGTYTLTVRAGFGDTSSGSYRLRIYGVPTASFTHSPRDPVAGDTVTFDASASRDLRGPIVKYEWDFDGDGNYDAVTTGPTTSHRYPFWGPLMVWLRVTNAAGATDATPRPLIVGFPPSPPPAPASAAASTPIPDLGQSANAAPVSGQVLFRPPGSSRYVPLTALTEIPVGSVVDTRVGVVQLTTAAKAAGRTHSARFRGGKFRFRQNRSGLTDLDLLGGSFSSCGPGQTRRARQAESARKKRTVRRLWGEGSGRFRTIGRYSSAAVRGTTWLTADRCDATLTRVLEGTVAVRDFGLRRTFLVDAGERYVARPANASGRRAAGRRP